MSTEERIAALKARHASLESAIEAENARPRPDENAIPAMKRQKLRIKDELAALSKDQS